MSEWLHLDGHGLEATNYRNEFILLRCKSTQNLNLPSVGQAILEQKPNFVEEVIATEVEICLKLNKQFKQDSLKSLQEINLPKMGKNNDNTCRLLKAPTYFLEQDSGDWRSIYQETGQTRKQYIEQLLACKFRVAMIGFLPGFLYLDGLPEELHVPRKRTPDKRTPANAFAVGGKYAGIYTLPSPTGWNVVGMHGVQLLTVDRLPPLQVQPGDRITLEQIDHAEYKQLAKHRPTLLEYNGVGCDG